MEEFEQRLEIPLSAQRNVFGQFDAYLKKLEQEFKVAITDRNGEVRITGEERNVKKATSVLRNLSELAMRGNEIEEQNVDYAITMSQEEDEAGAILEMDKECICHTISGKPIFAVQWHPERLCGAFARPESADGARLLRALLR